MQKFCHFASKNIYKWPKYETADCPSIIIDSINNSSLFAYYNNAIKDLWETSKPLDDN